MTTEEKKERARIANRKFYERHREQELVRCKQWRENNPDYQKNWAKDNPEKRSAASRKHYHQTTQEDFDRMMKEQDGKCAICKAELIRPDVDHDHLCCSGKKSCGKCTRGLLCRSCNTFIGLAKESLEFLENAIQYLKRHKEKQC